jgi:single-strand DNA-binding protein
MYNKVILIGNLGADPDIRVLDSGAKVAKFRIATNENYRDKSGEWQTITEWHNIVAWRGLAERVERDLQKGTQVFVEGKITHRKYTDKDNIERYMTDINAFLIRKLEKSDHEGSEPSPVSENDEESRDEKNTEKSSEKDENLEEDDLPF